MNDGRESLPRTPKVSEVVADRLRALILSQNMNPGDRLSSEPELITRYGVARSTIREALRLLEAEGTIEIKRGNQGGILVRQPDLTQIGYSITVLLSMNRATIRELLDFRILLEPAAAALAAQNASADQCAWLQELVRSESTLDMEHSVLFHEAVAECSNNTLFRMVIASMRQEMLLHSSGEQLSRSDLEATRKAHRVIAEAIEKHDAARAEKIMLRHVEKFRSTLEEQGRLDEPIIPRSRWAQQR